MDDTISFLRSINGLLIFSIGEHEFCIDISRVSAIIKPEEEKKYYEIYLKEMDLLKLYNGSFPVFNSKIFFGAENGEWTSDSRIILINCRHLVISLRADKVIEVISLIKTDDKNLLEAEIYSSDDYLIGKVKFENRNWLYPNIDKVCSQFIPD